MNNVCVITGGSSGIGLATAKLLKDHSTIIITGRSRPKLENAAVELSKEGINTDIFPCDVSNKEEVQNLVEYARQKGIISTVIHSAGISPELGTAEMIFNINALGSIYINDMFSKAMISGGCIIDISSMSAYLLPYLLPQNSTYQKNYSLSMTDVDAFQKSIFHLLLSLPEKIRDKAAYALSKHFVIWYASQCACLYGKEGIRVLSVSPGTFDTPMGQLGGKHSSSYALNGALGRVGNPDEIAQLLAFCASDAASYLTGTDILCDGGAVASIQRSFENKQ